MTAGAFSLASKANASNSGRGADFAGRREHKSIGRVAANRRVAAAVENGVIPVCIFVIEREACIDVFMR
jgi:hypothetical protein